jgi:NitT/TauT family transport system ATP-binding protein
MADKPNVVVSNISKTFISERGLPCEALRKVSFKCFPKDFLCILGPTGCGKSTLLRLIAGLLKPTQGSIEVENKTVIGPNVNVGMVFQEHSLFPWRTTIDNVVFGLEIQGVPKKKRYKVAQYFLELVGLKDFMQAYPYELSGGMRQRAAIARVLGLGVNILLMDEPFHSLDEWFREMLEEEIAKILEAARKTVIFVTHNIEEAVYLSQRILIMNPRPGFIVKDIRVPLERPRNRFDPKFIQYLLHVRESFRKIADGCPECTAEKRKLRRMGLLFPVTYKTLDTLKEKKCLGNDISQDGLGLFVREKASEGTIFALQIELGNGVPPITAEGRVIWQNSSPTRIEDRECFPTGVLFTKIDRETKHRIEQIILI